MNVTMADAVLSAVTSVSDIESVKRAMIARVAHVEEHFVRFRQRDEPDMSLDERLVIAEKLLVNSPGEFIARFGSTLSAEDLPYFDTVCSKDYAVLFRTAEIRQRLNAAGSKVQKAVVKNRRYDCFCSNKKFIVKTGTMVTMVTNY